MITRKSNRGLKHFDWTPAKVKLLEQLWCVDRFHTIIILNNLGCSRKQLDLAIKKFNLKRERKPSDRSKDTSFMFTPKLDMGKARKIRQLTTEGVSQRELVKKYNVCRNTIRLIQSNKIWKEPDMPVQKLLWEAEGGDIFDSREEADEHEAKNKLIAHMHGNMSDAEWDILHAICDDVEFAQKFVKYSDARKKAKAEWDKRNARSGALQAVMGK